MNELNVQILLGNIIGAINMYTLFQHNNVAIIPQKQS